MSRVTFTLLKSAVSLTLIAFIVRSVDGAALVAAVRQLAPSSLAAAALLLAIQAVIIGWRWHRIVALLGGRLLPSDAVNWVFIGMFFNNALPTSVGGDAVRIWLLRKSGAPLDLSFGSVAIERGTGIVILALMVSASVPAIWKLLDGAALRVLLTWIGPTLLAGLAVAALADKLVADWIPRSLGGSLRWLGRELRRLALRPLAVGEVAALSIAASFTGLLAAYLLGVGLGLNIGLPAYIVLVGGSMLLSVLPISVGGWGVREVSMVTLFGAVGGGVEQALALSLLYGVLPLLVSLPAVLLWWRGEGMQGARDYEPDPCKPTAPSPPES